MTKVGFFTPLTFGDEPKSYTQSFLETVDSYFYLGGKKAYVIPERLGDGPAIAVLTQHSPPFLLTALKVISYLTVAIPFAMLIAKVLLRSTHTYHLIDPQQELEKGMNLSQDTLETFEKEVRLNSYPRTYIHKDIPDLIIKVDTHEASERRFANMIKAKEFCLTHKLNLLIIPQAKETHVNGKSVIVKKRLKFNPNKSFQERLYQLDGLDKATKQLATFIALTVFSHVDWDTIPVLDSEEGEAGVVRDRRIALIDLEKMEDASIGFFGAAGRSRGLIRCLGSEEQIDAAISEAKQYKIILEDSHAENIKSERMNEIARDQKLHQFYEQNGVLENPRKPIKVGDLNSLGLDPKETCFERFENERGQRWAVYSPETTMERAIIEVIAAINDKIHTAPHDASVKGKRYIEVSDCGLRQDWFKRIIDALVEKRYVFALDRMLPYGCFIQV